MYVCYSLDTGSPGSVVICLLVLLFYSEPKRKVSQKRLGTWNKSWSVSSFFSLLLWKMLLWAEGLTLHCVFWRTTPHWHVIPYLCYTPVKHPGPLTCHPDSETQLFGWSDFFVLYFSWHFVFSTCVTKALLTSLISPSAPTSFSVINMICATLSLLPFVLLSSPSDCHHQLWGELLAGSKKILWHVKHIGSERILKLRSSLINSLRKYAYTHIPTHTHLGNAWNCPVQLEVFPVKTKNRTDESYGMTVKDTER